MLLQFNCKAYILIATSGRILKRLLSDNGTLFVTMHVQELFEGYGIDHTKLSLLYPQMNGRAEATNKTMLCIINRMVYEELKRWVDSLSLMLWVYRILKRTSTQAMLFSLVYWTESMVPIEIMYPSIRVALASRLSGSHVQIYFVEALEERRYNVEINGHLIISKLAKPITIE